MVGALAAVQPGQAAVDPRNRRSVPKKAKPMGASRRSVASKAESETSRPDTRGCGTEVSVLMKRTPGP